MRTNDDDDLVPRSDLGDRLGVGDHASAVPVTATSSRPDDWLEVEIALTAWMVQMHPDCDVEAVLRGFAAFVLAHRDGVSTGDARSSR